MNTVETFFERPDLIWLQNACTAPNLQEIYRLEFITTIQEKERLSGLIDIGN